MELNNSSNLSSSTKKIGEAVASKDVFFDLKLPNDFCRKSFDRRFCEHVKINLIKSKRQLPKVQCMAEILSCQHFKCLMRRLVIIFEALKLSPLLIASKSLQLLGITESPDWKADPSSFIISRLIEVDSDMNAINNEGICCLFCKILLNFFL